MKRRISQRFLSAFLALVLAFSCVPVAYAAEAETEPPVIMETEVPVTETAEAAPAEETEAPEEEPAQSEPETEPAQETQAQPEQTVPEETVPQVTVPEETVPEEETEPQETVPEETVPEETVPRETVPEETVPGETVPEEAVPEETVPVELPYGFAGLPEGYVLSEEDAATKQEMIDNKVLETLAGLTAGEGYEAEYVVVEAADEEEAALFAAAFSGELLSFSHGMARVSLQTATVAQAVEASLEPAFNLPAAQPDFFGFAEPIEETGLQPYTMPLPEQQDWASWVRDVLTNPDPKLLNLGNDTSYQWMHDTIGSYAAWGVTTGASWVKVAVIDTGINMSHEELASHISYIDIGYGTDDVADHGTHVAGIIAGTMNNGKGGAGVAPGVSIINIRAANSSGSFPNSATATAIYEAADAGAHIINMSLGGPGYSSIVQKAVNYAVGKGVTVFAATGNVGSNTISYPAAYDNVIAVAATSRNGSRAHFSNYGPWTDIAAPGDDIYSSVKSGGYAVYDGTSMACPVAAGVAALYTSAVGKRVDPATMEKLMESSATKTKESGIGAGIVNIANMLDGVPAAPYYRIVDESGREYSAKDEIPCNAVIYVYENEEAYRQNRPCDQNGAFLWTFDGKSPSIKNGQVVNGTVLPENVGVINSVPDTKVTVKVAYVSGMGIMGKVLSLNLKIVGHDDISSITVHGSSKLIPGKSCTYTATVNPADKADQKVTWEIYNSTISGAKIDAKTGKLTTPAGKTGTIRIRATSVADPSIRSSTFTVTVANISPITSITLNKTSISLFVNGTGSIRVSYMVNKDGNSVSASTSGVQWTSSNPKVLKIDANGNYTALSKGSATITCMALDGSGKKATCKVTVLQPVTSIAITGQGSIAPGTNATYKATVYPTTANNKKVTWSLLNAPSGVTIDAKSGKVTVASYVSTEKSFTVKATAADGSGTTASYTVRTRGKTTGISIGSNGYSGKATGIQKDSKGWVKTVNLFSVDLDSSSAADNQVDLDVYANNNSSSISVTWSSSAPHIASVSTSGVVTAHKAGTATITLKANDGSNKKATCTIKVTNPASYITISSSTVAMTSGRYFIGAGKSAKNTAVFANTYGKPTNQKVTWSYAVYELDSSGDIYATRTSAFNNKKAISLSSSGTLTVKPVARDLWLSYDGPIMIRVTAKATDGTGVKNTIDYMLIPATTIIKPEASRYKAPAGDFYTIYFYSDQWPGTGFGFNVTSSNPKVCSIHEDRTQAAVTYVGRSNGLYLYELYFVLPGTTGTATITIKAADGSNKTGSFTIKAY